MLSDEDINQLCQGRIIKATFYNSRRSNVAGPHYAVILDTDADIKSHDDYYVAVISSNDKIESEFLMPMPSYTGLSGFIVASWDEIAHLAGITQIGGKLNAPDMVKLLSLVRSVSLERAQKKKPTP